MFLTVFQYAYICQTTSQGDQTQIYANEGSFYVFLSININVFQVQL